MKKIFCLILILVSGIFFVLPNNFVFAQEAAGISISPVRFELTANPGDVLENKIKVFNPTDSVISLKIISEDFKAVGEEGHVSIDINEREEDEKIYSLKSWITTQPNEFILNPKETKVISFLIEIPKNAEPGGKYGSVIPTITGSVGEEFTGAKVSSSVAALVLLVVSGDIKEKLIIDSFTVPSFQEYGPVPFEMKFKNKGTVHVKPKGYIIVTDWFGKNVVELELPQKNVMPEATRKVEAEWDTKWLFGKYTASIIGVYGTSNENLIPRTITFWVLPWKLMLGILAVLLVIFVILFLSRKRLRMAAKILLKGEHRSVEKTVEKVENDV